VEGVVFCRVAAYLNDLFQRSWLLTEKIQRSKFAITISEFNRKFMIEQGSNPKKIHVIHCGIDSGRFFPLSRKKHKTPHVIGSLGRMVEKKGFDILLKAAESLKKDGLKFRLIIAGGGPLEQNLLAYTKKLGLLSVVEFPGPIANAKVADWLKSLDLFVLPCKKDFNGDMDGVPLVLMEVMACGIPVISSNVSGIPELITMDTTDYSLLLAHRECSAWQ